MYASGAAPHNGFIEASADNSDMEDYTRMLDTAFNTLRRYVSCLLLSFLITCRAGRVGVSVAHDRRTTTDADAASAFDDARLVHYAAELS